MRRFMCTRAILKKFAPSLIAGIIFTSIIGIVFTFAWQSVTIPFEVEEPLEILSYPSEFSLFPGETVEFNITLQNHASTNYSVKFEFQLNDSYYQANYVRFSDEVYNVTSGIQTLPTWFSVEPDAPTTQTSLTISFLRITPFIPPIISEVQHDIASLPAGNRMFGDPSDPTLPESRMLIDLDIAGRGQTVYAAPGETLLATCEYQIWSGAGNPHEINQGFFIMSWTPSWPPSSEYYRAVWNGISGVYPGVTSNASFSFQAPTTPGTYYLYWCGEAHYSIPQAVNNYDQDLGVPGTPAHAKIIVTGSP